MDLIYELQKSTAEKDNAIENAQRMINELKQSYEYNIRVDAIKNNEIEKLKNELKQINENKSEMKQKIETIDENRREFEQKYEEEQNTLKHLFRELERSEFNKSSLQYHIEQMNEVAHKLKMEQLQKAMQENQEMKRVLQKQKEQIEKDLVDLESHEKQIRLDGNDKINAHMSQHAENSESLKFKIQQIKAENQSLEQRVMKMRYHNEKKKKEHQEKILLAKEIKEKEDADSLKKYSTTITELRKIFEEKYMKVKELQSINDENINKAKCETDELAAIRNKQEQMEKDDKATFQLLKQKHKLFEETILAGLETYHKSKKTGNILQQQVLSQCYRDLMGNRNWEICKNEYESYKQKRENEMMFLEYQTKVRKEELTNSERELSSIWNIENDLQPKLEKSKVELEKSKKKLIDATEDAKLVLQAYYKQKEENAKIEAQLGYSLKKNLPPPPPKVSSISISPPIIIKPGANQDNIETLKQKLQQKQEKIGLLKNSIENRKKQRDALSKYNGDIKHAIIALALMTKKRKITKSTKPVKQSL